MIEGCIERGKEIKEGGAKYDFTGGQNVGIISAANALATVKKMVFDEKLLSAQQLKHALDTNFEDQTTQPSGEVIRQMLLNADSKFGNDNDEPDGDRIGARGGRRIRGGDGRRPQGGRTGYGGYFGVPLDRPQRPDGADEFIFQASKRADAWRPAVQPENHAYIGTDGGRPRSLGGAHPYVV